MSWGKWDSCPACDDSRAGAVLLTRLLGLNDTEESILNIVFRVAERAWPSLRIDLMDLRGMLNFVAENAGELSHYYGNIPGSFGWRHLA